MNRNGFISISVVYTLFIVLLMLLLSILANLVNQRILLKVNKGDITDILVESEDNRNIATVCLGKYMANCFAKNSNLDRNLYYHDGSKDYISQTNENLEANDGNFRYAGGNPNNYICLDNTETLGTCNSNLLYRIIGVFSLGTHLNNETQSDIYALKVIKDTPQGSLSWNNINNNNWWDSSLNTFLNSDSSPVMALNNYMVESEWHVGKQDSTVMIKKENQPLNAFKAEHYIDTVGVIEMKTYGKVGLMYASDYYYAAAPGYWSYIGDKSGTSILHDYRDAKTNNWLAGNNEYLITTDPSTTEAKAYYLYASGLIGTKSVTEALNYRPVFSIKPGAILQSGFGSKEEPYRLKVS